MESIEQTLNGADGLLRKAAENAGAVLPAAEIETLALKIAFALNVQPQRESNVLSIAKGMTRSPSLALATSMALRVRDSLNVGDTDPLFDLPALLSEKLNVDVLLVEADRVSGGCVLMNAGAFIVLPTTRRLSDLFVCAHELGHLLLLSARNNHEGAAFDCFGDGTRPVRSPYEHFADAFARELLIPSRGLGIASQEIRKQFTLSGPIGDIELLYLSRVFGVSFLVMAKRCERLGLLPEGAAVTLYKLLVEQFGGPEQRADMVQLPPRRMIDIPLVPPLIQAVAIREIANRSTSTQQPSAPDLPANRKLA